MNDAAFQYEDFSTAVIQQSPLSEDMGQSEDRHLEAYEEGFQAGWDDANAAQSRGSAALETAAMQTLSDLSFTLAEAKSHTLAALKPLMEQLAHSIMPMIARDSLAPLIVEKILEAARKELETDLTLCIAPEDRNAIEVALEGHNDLPLRIVDEETLISGQASLDLGTTQHQIDLPALNAEIENAVSEFYALQPALSEDRAHAV